MHISGNSIFINYPKTGSSFIRQSLDTLNANIEKDRVLKITNPGKQKTLKFEQVLVPQIRNTRVRYLEPDPHGVCDQIPIEHQNKAVFSVYRGVFDRLVSVYTYADYKRVNYFPDEVVKKYGDLAKLSFDDFIDLYYTHPPGTEGISQAVKDQIGPLTIQFIKFFFVNGIEMLKTGDILNVLDDSAKHMHSVKWIDFRDLSNGLYMSLKNQGYPNRLIKFIRNSPKVNVSRDSGLDLSNMYSSNQVKEIESKERLLITFEDEFPQC